MARTLSSTTNSNAVGKSDTSLVLASVTGLQVGHLLVFGKEAASVIEIVGLRVDVQRGYRGTPTAVPAGSTVYYGPGSDFYATEPSGTGDPNTEVVLPRVVLPQIKVYDLVGGQWVLKTDAPKDAEPDPVYLYTAAGAIAVAKGLHRVSGAAHAMTLANPTAEQEGTRMSIRAASAHAITVTVTGGFAGAGAGADVGTFGGAIGDGLDIIAVNLLWHVVALRNVTLA